MINLFFLNLIFQGHIKVTKSLTLKLKDLQKKERLKRPLIF